ncbi:MAG: PorV/PorQ family protein [Bacteroidetes Order II. Incertae sedis bacterium]|nr:PorV/PorQ family protein [Bacteroidetes Order II. bacterium]
MLNRLLLWLGGFITLVPSMLPAQTVAKYGADFLSGGVDARAMAMGNTHIAFTQSASSTYWNPAGLAQLKNPDIGYMHAERFGGIVSFDYAGIGFPVGQKSAIGFAAIRSGVNDIKDTRDAWDFERDTPKPNPENNFRLFSAADYAFYLTYGRKVHDHLTVGASGKLIRRKIGPYADAWGYSLDAGAQYQKGKLRLGINLQDVTTMLQSWSINQSEFSEYPEYGVPKGGTEMVLPVVRLGSGYDWKVGQDGSQLSLGLDVDMAFDGQQKYAFSAGNLSIHPRLGAEYQFKKAFALRTGIANFSKNSDGSVAIRPMVGLGLMIRQAAIDYVFGDFSGPTAELGNSHMISVRLALER